jgi:membrane protease YdiL (CAAX protease family)
MRNMPTMPYAPRAVGHEPAGQWPAYAAILGAACLVALFLAFSGDPIARVLTGWFPSDNRELQSALFSVYYLGVGVLTTIWWPRRFGWQTGTIRAHWRLLAGLGVGLSLASISFILAAGPIPFHDFPWSQFTLAPLTEEAVFRGLLFTGILYLLRRAQAGPRAPGLAIAFSAIAFGLAHSANYLYYPAGFVTFQIAEATLLGALLAYTRVKTDSLYPAIGLHALVNFLTNVL